MGRNPKYRATVNKEGVFNTKISNKLLIKQLDAICLLTNQNKTKYMENALEIQINKDLEKFNELLENKGE